MRIAQLAGWYSPVSGGIRTVVHRLGAGFRAAGHDTVLVVPAERDTVAPDRITLRAPVIPGSGGYRLVVRRGVLAAALDRAAPDVVELHDKAWLPAVRRWADRHGVPVVLVSHERLDRTLPMLAPWLPGGAAAWASDRVRCMMQRNADVVVVCSEFAGAEFPHARRVPLGVDLDGFAPVPGAANSGVHLVLASRLAREKRPDVAVDTVAALRRRGTDARLTVFGTGPLLSGLRSRAAGLPVHFAGFTADRASFAHALAGADIVLAPGPAETFGLSALEALASGPRWSALRARPSRNCCTLQRAAPVGRPRPTATPSRTRSRRSSATGGRPAGRRPCARRAVPVVADGRGDARGARGGGRRDTGCPRRDDRRAVPRGDRVAAAAGCLIRRDRRRGGAGRT